MIDPRSTRAYKLEKENRELKKEIGRLNNRVKQLEKSIMISNKKHSFITKDNIKLRTIINELEKYIVIKLKEFNTPEEYYTLKQIEDIHYKLQKLKHKKIYGSVDSEKEILAGIKKDQLQAQRIIIIKQEQEIQRLNYIIYKLEKWSEEYRFADIFKNKLQELKKELIRSEQRIKNCF